LNIKPKTRIGIAYIDKFIFIQNAAINQAQVVVPILAQNIIHIHCTRVISSALKKEIVNNETKELDCIIVADVKPNNKLFHVLFVLL
jgi:hypothetical protein